jgi:hypothetical protein
MGLALPAACRLKQNYVVTRVGPEFLPAHSVSSRWRFNPTVPFLPAVVSLGLAAAGAALWTEVRRDTTTVRQSLAGFAFVCALAALVKLVADGALGFDELFFRDSAAQARRRSRLPELPHAPLALALGAPPRC